MKKPKTKKAKIIRNVGILGITGLALVGVYAGVIEFFLKDLQNLSYLNFYYSPDGGGATIRSLNGNKKYPENFVIPKKLLGRPVVEIGEGAFSNYDRLKSVTIPDTVTKIGKQAFFNSSNLEHINFSKNIISIGSDAIEGTPFYEKQNEGFVLLGKVAYKYKGVIPAGSVLVPENSDIEKAKIAEGLSDEQIIKMDSNLSVFADGLFANQKNLEEAYLPSTLTVLPNEVFKGNTALKKVEYSINTTEIGFSAFENTPNLNNLTLINDAGDPIINESNTIGIGEKVRKIGYSAFANSSLTGVLNFGSELVSIGKNAFENNEFISEVTTNKGLEEIGAYAFANNISLQSIDFSLSNDSLAYIGENALSNTALVEVNLPSQLEIISAGLFQDTATLKKVTIEQSYIQEDHYDDPVTGEPKVDSYPVALSSIRENAFKGTTNLKTIAIRKTGQNGTITQLTPDNEVHIPGNVYDENNPTSVVYDNVFSFGSGNNFSGSGIEKVFFPEIVSGTLPEGMFENTPNLVSVDFSKLLETTHLKKLNARIFQNTPMLETLVLPNSVATIESNAFFNSGIKSFKLPDSVQTIFSNSFRSTKLESFTFNDRLKTIDSFAFADNEGLTSIVLPESIEYIRNAPFANTPNLSSITILGNPKISNFNQGLKDSSITEFVVPAGIKDNELSASTFENATKLVNVVLPENLVKIGEKVFYNTLSLENINLPVNLQSVGKEAFHNSKIYNDTSTGHVIIDKLYYAYKDDNGTNVYPESELVIPDGVEIISDSAFENSSNIKSVSLPASLKYIGKAAFNNISGLETVTFRGESNLIKIGEAAFKNSGIKSFILPDSVLNIDQEAFAENKSLTTFTVSTSSKLQTIGLRAFSGDSLLTEFYLPGSLVLVSSNAFALCNSLTIYYHPNSNPSTNKNKFDNNWNFSNRPTIERA